MSLMPEQDVDWWRELWLTRLAENPMTVRHRRTVQERAEKWNRRAEWFSKQVSGQEGNERTESVMLFLKQEQALPSSGSRVLDIGAGSGAFTIPFLALGADVVALEPAESMIDIIRRNCDEAKVPHPTFVQKTWQDIDLDADGMRGAFDLAFGCMTPGVRDPKTIDKLSAASKCHCFFSVFSGQRWRDQYGEVWKKIFNEEITTQAPDVSLAFQYLYAKGYRPTMKFRNTVKKIEQTPEEVMESMLLFLDDYTEIDDQIRKYVELFIQDRITAGLFRLENTNCQGMMVWSV